MTEPVTPLTKAEFDALMEQGWEGLGYIEGELCDSFTHPTRVCAIGAVMNALGAFRDPYEGYIWDRFKVQRLWCTAHNEYTNPLTPIMHASNAAGSKEAAIAAVKALQW